MLLYASIFSMQKINLYTATLRALCYLFQVSRKRMIAFRASTVHFYLHPSYFGPYFNRLCQNPRFVSLKSLVITSATTCHKSDHDMPIQNQKTNQKSKSMPLKTIASKIIGSRATSVLGNVPKNGRCENKNRFQTRNRCQ